MRFPVLALSLAVLCGCPARAQEPPRVDMEGRSEPRPETHDTRETAELKARFTVDYMLKASQRRQVFASYLDTLGTQGILDVLEARNPLCHSEAHELGRAVYSHFKDLGRALHECGSRCSSACLHGVLKEAFGGSTLDQMRPQLAAICTQGAMADIRRPGNCAHGMGHALMLVTGGDVEKSIDGCAGFATPAMDYYCVTGVYMELFDQGAAKWTGKGPFYPCDTYTRFPAACYRYQAARMLGALGGDRARLADLCRSLPTDQRRGCFHGAGFAALPAVAQKPELIANACPDQPVEDQTLCLEGLVESFAAFEPEKAAASCGSLTGHAAEICQAAAREGTYRLNKPSLPLYLGQPTSPH
ncbi:MAG TPA: hypothetical protein VEW48_07875 [Thermoanaerobaculia bacterium]|nr:hypothetical protein [Thermoanaerobaculia bacterium]